MRWMTALVLGVVMIVIGLFVAFRPLFTHNATLTGARWLDIVFALAFLFRGYLNIKTALQRRKRSLAQG